MSSKKRKMTHSKSGYVAPAEHPADPPARGVNLSTVLHYTLYITGIIFYILGTIYYVQMLTKGSKHGGVTYIYYLMNVPPETTLRGVELDEDLLSIIILYTPYIIATTIHILATVFFIRIIYRRVKLWKQNSAFTGEG